EPSALNWMTHLELNLRLPELLLARVDRMTMASSVEGREPFLDHVLVELALSIPTSVKLGNGELKHILKLALRGVVPDEVLDRRKQGFTLPLTEWMSRGVSDVMRERVESFARSTGILDSRRVSAFMAEAQWSKAWLLFNLAAWYD